MKQMRVELYHYKLSKTNEWLRYWPSNDNQDSKTHCFSRTKWMRCLVDVLGWKIPTTDCYNLCRYKGIEEYPTQSPASPIFGWIWGSFEMQIVVKSQSDKTVSQKTRGVTAAGPNKKTLPSFWAQRGWPGRGVNSKSNLHFLWVSFFSSQLQPLSPADVSWKKDSPSIAFIHLIHANPARQAALSKD